MARNPKPAVLAGFAVTVVLVGLNFVAVRMSNVELAPTWGAGLRFAVAAWLLALLVVVRRIPMPRGRALAGSAVYGVFMFAIFFGFIYWGLVEVPAAVGSILNATVPLMTFALAASIGLERFRWSAVVGGVTVIGGIAILAGSATLGDASPARFAAVLVACAAVAVGSVVVKWFPRNHPVATNAVGMGVACVLLLIVSALRREPWSLPDQDATWLALAFLVASSLVLFPILVWVIAEWSASAGAYVVVLAPLVTVPVGAWILGEGIGGRFALAAVVILVGVYAGTLWRGRRTAESDATGHARPER